MPTIHYFWQSAEELQSELNYFYEYCEKWNLKVNTKKSKVMVFSKGRLPINLNSKMTISHNIHKNNLIPSAILQQTLPKVLYRRHKEW
jgi:hypothetical protein